MAKIETYVLATSPLSFSDMLIGTEVNGPIPNATKNFSLGELYQLFSTLPMVGNLQQTLDAGNTATQNIILTGDVASSTITPQYIVDGSSSTGSVGNALLRGTSGIYWGTVINPNLQQVLNEGNTATGNIVLTGNITSTKIIPADIQDVGGNIGTVGQILTKSSVGFIWANSSIVGGVTSVTASSPLASSGGSTPNITIQQSNGSQDGYLSSGDWTIFNSKQVQLNGTGFVKASGTTITYDNSTYLTTGDAVTYYVPYTGATGNINIGINAILGTISSNYFLVNANEFILTDSSSNTNNISKGRVQITHGSSGNYVEIDAQSATPYIAAIGAGGSGSAVLLHSSGESSLVLSDSSSTKVLLSTNGNSYINPTGTGRLGIGTDAPSDKLHIKDTVPSLRIEATNGLTVSGYLSTNPFGIGYGSFDVTSTGHIKLISGITGTGSQYVIDAIGGNHWFGNGFSSFPTTSNKFWFKGGSMYVEDRISTVTLGVGFNSTINASAAFEIQSTSKGFLFPRMTTTQRDAISTPAIGLTIYNTSTNKHNYYDGSQWVEMGTGTSTSVGFEQNFLLMGA